MPKKTERRDHLRFFKFHSVAKHQKTDGEFCLKMVSQCRKNSLVSPGIVCFAEKDEKPFWFSSLDQMIQFGTIQFRRTLENYFGQFEWIE